ncbi:MAG: DUF4468 domain-containing protein [Bacteroidales bacterium]|nr:DUF4468 domain-containing protein [Bacteroidales bacterium]
MKYVIIVALTLLCLGSYSQEPFIIEEVVQSEGISADDLYKNAKDWLIRTFVDANEVIQYENREEGEIQVKAITNYSSPVLVGSVPVSGYISYILTIKVKDGRYKYQFSNFVHSGTDTQYNAVNFGLITTETIAPKLKGQMKNWCQKQWEHMKKISEGEAYNLIPGLKDAMNKIPESDDEW